MQNDFGGYFKQRRPDPYGLRRRGSTRLTRGLWWGIVVSVVLEAGFVLGFALGWALS